MKVETDRIESGVLYREGRAVLELHCDGGAVSVTTSDAFTTTRASVMLADFMWAVGRAGLYAPSGDTHALQAEVARLNEENERLRKDVAQYRRWEAVCAEATLEVAHLRLELSAVDAERNDAALQLERLKKELAEARELAAQQTMRAEGAFSAAPSPGIPREAAPELSEDQLEEIAASLADRFYSWPGTMQQKMEMVLGEVLHLRPAPRTLTEEELTMLANGLSTDLGMVRNVLRGAERRRWLSARLPPVGENDPERMIGVEEVWHKAPENS